MTELEQLNINREFFKAAIKRQIMRCIEKDYYKAGVFTLDNKTTIVTDIVKEIIQNDFAEYINIHIRTSQYITEVLFENGSTLKVVRGSDNARGYKFNDIIYDSIIENHVVSMIILPRLIPYYIKNYDNNEFRIDCTRLNMRLVECEI